MEIIEIYSRRVAKNYVYQRSNFCTAYKLIYLFCSYLCQLNKSAINFF
nr:hypothetical protein B11C_110287 [Bartonella sp. 1-1C]